MIFSVIFRVVNDNMSIKREEKKNISRIHDLNFTFRRTVYLLIFIIYTNIILTQMPTTLLFVKFKTIAKKYPFFALFIDSTIFSLWSRYNNNILVSAHATPIEYGYNISSWPPANAWRATFLEFPEEPHESRIHYIPPVQYYITVRLIIFIF